MRAFLLALAVLPCGGCLQGDPTPEPPSCADLGCPAAPSGDPDIYTTCPATEDLCYCRVCNNEPAALCRRKVTNP